MEPGSPVSELPRRTLGVRFRDVLDGDFGALHLRLRLAHVVLFFCPRLCFNRLRAAVYRLCGVRVGGGTMILGTMTLSGSGPVWKRFTLGENCLVTTPLFADLGTEISVGSNVALGHHVILITSQHDMSHSERRCGALSHAPIRIEDGCWIGARATVLPGVTVGAGSVVAAGAVVASNVPPNTLVGGVPAKIIKELGCSGVQVFGSSVAQSEIPEHLNT